ncbi:mechanosensitive ion channel [Candidatus Woesearchaeota archaeon]|jgi:small-conductance mechanosensitive channel|nr:mechanosensitive ion channel [Candidatus Woesearchaeota archaeon]
MSEYFAIVIILLAIFLAFAVKYIYNKILSKHIKNYKPIFNKIINAFMLLIIASGFFFSFQIFQLPIEVSLLIKLIILVLSLYLLFLLTNYFTDNLAHVWYKGKIKAKLQLITILNYVLKVSILAFILIVLLKVWNFDAIAVSKEVYWVLQQNDLTESISLFVIYLIIAKVVLYLFKTYFTQVVKRTKTKMDDIFVKTVEYPITWVIVLIGVAVALRNIELGQQYILPIIKTVIVFIIIHTLIKLSDELLEEWWQEAPEKINEDIIQISSNFIKILLIIMGLFFTLIIWGADLKSLLLSVGIISVVLGFALKGTLDNVFSGISLMIDHTFRVGDVLKLESGELGEVVHIGLRSTQIKTYDHELLIVPNGVLATMRIINYAKPDKNLRVVIPVSVVYGSSIEKVKKILIKAVSGIQAISLPSQTEVRFIEMNDFSLDFNLIFYIDDYRKKYKAENRANTLIYNALNKNNIQIPFPTRTIYMDNGKKSPNKINNNKKRKVKKK